MTNCMTTPPSFVESHLMLDGWPRSLAETSHSQWSCPVGQAERPLLAMSGRWTGDGGCSSGRSESRSLVAFRVGILSSVSPVPAHVADLIHRVRQGQRVKF